jgi:hypothetical protein
LPRQGARNARASAPRDDRAHACGRGSARGGGKLARDGRGLDARRGLAARGERVCRGRGFGRPQPLRLPLVDLDEHLVRTHHAEFVARALLDREQALPEVLHFGVEGQIALLQPFIVVLPRKQLAIELPDPQPAPLAEPERILDQH